MLLSSLQTLANYLEAYGVAPPDFHFQLYVNIKPHIVFSVNTSGLESPSVVRIRLKYISGNVHHMVL